MERWRLKIAIKGKIAFLSHLDLLSVWERALRRAGLPVLLSEGFNPHMQISFGPAHAVGMESIADYFDIDMADGLTDGWYQDLNNLLPDGLQVLAARKIIQGTPSLMSVINVAAYEIIMDYSALRFDNPINEINRRIAEFMAMNECVVERCSPKGRKLFDIRPGIKKLEYIHKGLLAEVSVGSNGNVRPTELVNRVFPDVPLVSYCRTGLFIGGSQGTVRELP